jgi:hypothetical protein
MNDSSEMWSQPWQALQKNLVKGIRGAEMLGSSGPSLEVPNVLSFAVPADSWLSRARDRAPVTQVRR